MLDLYLTYIINLLASFMASQTELSNTTKILYNLNLISILLLSLSIILVTYCSELLTFAQQKLMNILFIFSFFNTIAIFVVYQSGFIYYWFKGNDVLLELTSLIFLPLPLLDIILLPFILYYLKIINIFLIRVIFWLTYAFGYFFDFIINWFIMKTLRTYLFFIYAINISFMLSWFPLYLFFSMFMLICVFIIRSPYFFELLNSQNIFDNINYLQENVESFTNFNVPEDASSMTILANIMFISVHKNNIISKRFVSFSKPLLTEDFLPSSGKNTGLTRYFLFNADNFHRMVVIMKEHPHEARMVFRGFFSLSMLGFCAHIFNLQQKSKLSGDRVKEAELNLENTKIHFEETKTHFEETKAKLEVSKAKLEVSKATFEQKAQMLKDKRALFETIRDMDESKVELAKLMLNKEKVSPEPIQYIDATPTIPLNDLENHSENNTKLFMSFEPGDSLDFDYLICFLNHFFNTFLF